MKKLYKLKLLRKNKKITQKKLAEKLNVNKQYIWQIENGKRNLSYDLAYKISQVLETKPDDLFWDKKTD